jgi:hypothetical protein
MFLKIYYEYSKPCDARSIGFLSPAYHAYVGFSMGFKRLFLRLFHEKRLFSGFIVRLTITEYGAPTLRTLISACVNITFFLYGKDKYGNK